VKRGSTCPDEVQIPRVVVEQWNSGSVEQTQTQTQTQKTQATAMTVTRHRGSLKKVPIHIRHGHVAASTNFI
jgi:hypothetical protein